MDTLDFRCGRIETEFLLPYKHPEVGASLIHQGVFETKTLRTFQVVFEHAGFGMWEILRAHHQRTASAFKARLTGFPDPVQVQYAKPPRQQPESANRTTITVFLREALATSAT